MKSTILAIATNLLFASLVSAQNQLPFKVDTAAAPKLGFHKKNQLSFPLKDSLVISDFNFGGTDRLKPKLAASFSAMPIIVPNGRHTMPVHSPDTTVTYKKQVFNSD